MTKDKQIIIDALDFYFSESLIGNHKYDKAIKYLEDKALEKAFPKKTITMREAIKSQKDFRFKGTVLGSEYDFKVIDGKHINSNLSQKHWNEFLYACANLEVEIIDD